jgi:hypothetical protein
VGAEVVALGEVDAVPEVDDVGLPEVLGVLVVDVDVDVEDAGAFGPW